MTESNEPRVEVTQADRAKDRRRLMLKLARAHDRNVSEREQGAETALRCGNGLATPYWEEMAKVAEKHFASRSRTAAEAASRADEDEAYQIGVRDGRCEALAEIDRLTGGDGEYFASTIGDDCRDADAMRDKIVKRFTEAASRDAIEEWKGEAAFYRHEAGVLAADLAAARSERDALREALRPLASAADFADERMIGRYLKADLPDDTVYAARITLGDLRRARALLARQADGGAHE